MSWVEAGRAWGERALDWAYLCEAFTRQVNEELFRRVSVGPGTNLIDIACGSGFAANLARNLGANVTGIDASEALIAIARSRTPQADFRVGDMFSLPFDDNSFDAAVSFSGIGIGSQNSLSEAARVVRPGGLIGFSFLGSPKRIGLAPCFEAVLRLSPPSHAVAVAEQGNTGRPGVAEQLLAEAGLCFVERGIALGISEWPDLDIAVRALASSGTSWPALKRVGYKRFADAIRDALSPSLVDGIGLRIVSEFGWITGRVVGR
ncbi:class I SAM-dependent methyltransferase [Mycobacterium decipiens]|nr:class I SAM-dependent methyltransferase [Mycobacterium decipiens]